MKKKKKIETYVIISITLILLVFGLASLYIYIDTENKNEYNLDKNFELLYSKNQINTEKEVSIGTGPITISIFTDPTKKNTEILRIINQIIKDHLDNKNIKIINKFYITENDILEKNERFILSNILKEQYNQIEEDNFNKKTNLFLMILENSSDEIKLKLNLSEKINEIIKNKDTFNEKQAYNDYTEIRRFGMVGIHPFFVIGINGRDNQIITGTPTYRKINKTINEYYTRIGYAY